MLFTLDITKYGRMSDQEKMSYNQTRIILLQCHAIWLENVGVTLPKTSPQNICKIY